MSIITKSGDSGDLLKVNTYGQSLTKLGNPLETDGTEHPEMVGSARMFSTVDDGVMTGTADLKSPETDDDYRLRIAHDTLMDYDEFDYAAQNTGKHTFRWQSTG